MAGVGALSAGAGMAGGAFGEGAAGLEAFPAFDSLPAGMGFNGETLLAGEGAGATGFEGGIDFLPDAASYGSDAGILSGEAGAGAGIGTGAGVNWADRAAVSAAENMFNEAGSGGLTGDGAFKLPFGLGWKDIITGGLGVLGSLDKSNKLDDAANTALNNTPINQPQRQPYQTQLLDLMRNPTNFFNTNPLFQAQKDQATNAFNAQYAKQGMGGTQINDYMKNIMNAGAGTFFDQGNLLAGLG